MSEAVIVTKIGKNYGALLQAFALKKAVEKTGANVRIVNYALSKTMQTYEILPKITGLSTLKAYLKSARNYSETKKSVSLFLKFREEYFSFTKVYHDFDELSSDPPKADVYITGSDQVWNPCINFDPAYYLMFGDENAVRASYAASVGVEHIPDEYKDEFVKRLSNVRYKSVRETSAKNLLDELGIESEVCLDPTLLHDSSVYDEISCEPEISQPYVLLYLLVMPENVEEYVAAVRKKYPRCKIVSIPGSPTSKRIGDVQMGGIGPKEFLGLVKSSQAVVTSSFHGTVFSVVFKKKFMSVLPAKTGGRIKDLLDKLDLSKRIASSPEDISAIDREIDYENVTRKLDKLKKASYEYLFKIFGQSYNLGKMSPTE